MPSFDLSDQKIVPKDPSPKILSEEGKQRWIKCSLTYFTSISKPYLTLYLSKGSSVSFLCSDLERLCKRILRLFIKLKALENTGTRNKTSNIKTCSILYFICLFVCLFFLGGVCVLFFKHVKSILFTSFKETD